MLRGREMKKHVKTGRETLGDKSWGENMEGEI